MWLFRLVGNTSSCVQLRRFVEFNLFLLLRCLHHLLLLCRCLFGYCVCSGALSVLIWEVLSFMWWLLFSCLCLCNMWNFRVFGWICRLCVFFSSLCALWLRQPIPLTCPGGVVSGVGGGDSAEFCLGFVCYFGLLFGLMWVGLMPLWALGLLWAFGPLAFLLWCWAQFVGSHFYVVFLCPFVPF